MVRNMVGVNVIAEKGVTYSEYRKNDKHRIYFKSAVGGGKPVEVGNYDLKESAYFPARGSQGQAWGIVDENDNPQALIIIGDSKKVFVGPARKQSNNGGGNRSYQRYNGNGGGANNNRDRDIKMGMCQNQAANIVAAFNPLEKGMADDEIAEMVKSLRDAIFEANCA